MAPNLLNRILAPVAPYKLVIVPHKIDPESNAAFDVKKVTYGFFNKENIEETISNYKKKVDETWFLADGANACRAYDLKTNTKFQQGKQEDDVTYVCFSQFSGDVCLGERYPQDYEVTIHPDFKKYFPMKN